MKLSFINFLFPFFLIILVGSVFLPTSFVFAGNPVTPIVPGDNIQDPGDPGTPWGGCGPTDSNCYVTVTGTSQWITAGSNIYYNTGGVGIGTTPQALSLLHISDSYNGLNATAVIAKTSAYSDVRLQFQLNADTGVGFGGIARGMTLFSGGHGPLGYSGWADYEGRPLLFYTGFDSASAERMRIDNTGQVNIGGNTNPTNMFSVGSTSQFQVDSSGNVGIGIAASGSYPLQVHGTGVFTAEFSNSTSSTGTYIGNAQSFSGDESGLYNDGGDTPLAVYDNTNNYVHYTSSITVADTGYVGIGNNTPAELLSIGANSGSLGTLSLSGNTSGKVIIQPQAAAGTYNFNLPTTAGNSGEFLTSAGGAGTAMTWTAPGALAVRWNNIADPNGNQTLSFGTNTSAWTSTATTQTFLSVTANSLTTGQIINIGHTTSVIADGGSLIRATSSSVDTGGATNGTLLDLSASGAVAGTLARITASAASQTTDTALNVIQSGATITAYTGNLVNFTGGFSGGSSSGSVLGITTVNSNAGSGITINANSLTGGSALIIPHTTSVISGGSLLKLQSTSADTGTSSGTLLNLVSTAATVATLALITNSATSFAGKALSINMGTSLTTGNALSITGGAYAHTAAETGNLINLAYTENSSAAFTTITNGILITPTFSSTGANTRTLNGISIAPAIIGCGATAGTCNLANFVQTTPALTQSTTNTFNIYGINLSSAGALVQSSNSGVINWIGQNIQMPNITQTTGTVTSIGIKITGGTVTSGTSYAFISDVNAGNVGIGTATPATKLDVTGSITSSSQFLAANGTAVSPGFAFTNATGIGYYTASSLLVQSVGFPTMSTGAASGNSGYVQHNFYSPSSTDLADGYAINFFAGGSTYATAGAFEANAGFVGTSSSLTNGLNFGATASGAGIKFYTNSYTNKAMELSSANLLTTYGGAVFNESGIDADFRIEGDTNTNLLFVDASVDQIGVGDATPDYLLDVENTGTDGNIFALHDSDGECLYNPESGAVTVSCSSDERLKTNITDTVSALSYFSDFHIREYDVIASGDHMTGVIAQEILQTHSELVTIGTNGMYSVQLPNQWQVIKAIQELDLKIKGIENLDQPDNSFGAKLRAWFANVANNIEEFVAGRIKARQEICINDTCINEAQLKEIINSSPSTVAPPPPPPDPIPDPTPQPEAGQPSAETPTPENQTAPSDQ